MTKENLLLFSGISSDSTYIMLVDKLILENIPIHCVYFGEIQDDFYQSLNRRNCRVTVISANSWILRIQSTWKTLSAIKIKMILCNGQVASILGITLGSLLRVKTRIYVRHWNSAHWNLCNLRFIRALLADLTMNFLSSRIIAVAPSVITTLRREGAASDKILLITNGIELNELISIRSNNKEGRFHDNFIRIGYIGRLDKKKGVEYLLHAFRNLSKSRRNLRLIIGGPIGDGFDRICSLIKSIPDGLVDLRPYRVDKRDFYSELDILVHLPISPSAEAFGLVYIEGIAAGLKCVFTKSGILQDIELPQTQKQIRFVPHKDAKSTMIAIQECIEDFQSGEISVIDPQDLGFFAEEIMIEKYLELFRASS